MPALLYVRERSTQQFEIIICDDNGDPVVPIAATYTLTNRNGDVMNNVEDIALTPALSMIVTVAGDDLSIENEDNTKEYRILTVKSDRGDVNKPENIQTPFWLENLKVIAT